MTTRAQGPFEVKLNPLPLHEAGQHEGSFALQHPRLMTRGTPGLTISVVPDSGTECLTGLTGTMTI